MEIHRPFAKTRQDRIMIVAMMWAPEGKRKRGQPRTKLTWRRTIEKERMRGEWKTWDEMQAVATERSKWMCHLGTRRIITGNVRTTFGHLTLYIFFTKLLLIT